MTESEDRRPWLFAIDVGGTFTDVVARRPDGAVVTHKLLSSGVVRGVVGGNSSGNAIQDETRCADPPDFWRGCRIRMLNDAGGAGGASFVTAFDAARGLLICDQELGSEESRGKTYELCSGDEAPIVAIRYLMGLSPDEPIGAVDVRLGTTRATNALLERKGARVALVATRGFGDALRIGYQDRPALFDLHIRKRVELSECVLEIAERLGARGEVLVRPDPAAIRQELTKLRARGITSLAICLLHAHINPAHEELVAHAADGLGFDHISLSSQVARMEKLVPRGDTTLVDAYLSPVIRSYVASLRGSLPQGRLRLMTSNGGLIDAASVTGKDTLLSGPAGGVVGSAHVARSAGGWRVIGFDMGGTSTDVARVEPPPAPFEYQFETVKAGVRVVAPMLAIETVAAGGGSICSFDGQMLRVGPQSAGADPGPACYGRGGPLTVTDVNLFLGRLVPAYFPFPLDRAAVEQRLEALRQAVAGATKTSMAPMELADGLVRIANANMAAAIKRISIQQGYDARDYALHCFGGAGGQHACAVARALGMRRILISPFAGVMSAWGIAVAPIKRMRERGVRAPLDASAVATLHRIAEELAAEAHAALAAEGFASDRLSSVCTWDLAYQGQGSTITVPAGAVEDAQRSFEQEHRRQYGYAHEGRRIEVQVVRVEVRAGESVELPRYAAPEMTRVPSRAWMIVGGSACEVPVHSRADCRRYETVKGPAIIAEEHGTVVVDHGWAAQLGENDLLHLSFEAQDLSVESKSTAADPVRLELFNNRFAAIAEQMGATLRRTAMSTNVKERLDYSCAVFTPDGDLVANAPHIPVHLGGMSDCVKALIEDIGGFEPGDVYVTNDPFRGGSHLNDVTVVTPVYDPTDQRLVFFVANRAHHAEIGGSRPGSMPPDSRTLAEEGVLIRGFRLLGSGQTRWNELRALLTSPPYPSRAPDENLADIAAQVAANQTGARELLDVAAACGLSVVHAFMGHVRDAAERKMRAALARLPRGTRRFADGLDDGAAISLTLTLDGETATFDFSGTAPVHAGNLNANRAIVTSAIMYCLRCLIAEDIPLNAGVLAPVSIVLPEGMLNPRGAPDPRDCPAMVGGNVETSQRIVDCIFGALGIVAASQGTMNNLLMGNERFGYYETICGGGGAGPDFDGADAVHTHMTNTRLTDPEVLESRYPVRVHRFEIRRGSGGAGRHKGGDGVIREIEFLEPLEVSILSQRRRTAPYGVAGGAPGLPGKNRWKPFDGDETLLPPIAQLSARPGDRLTIETPGGGGYGSPA